MRLIIHLQFGCSLSCSCLCSSLRRQGLALLARSTGSVSRLITRGVVVLRLQGLIFRSEAGSCVILCYNDSYLYLTEDRDPRSHKVVIRAKVYRQVHIYPLVLSVSHSSHNPMPYSFFFYPTTFRAIAFAYFSFRVRRVEFVSWLRSGC